MVPTGASDGEPKTQGRNRRKAKAYIKSSLPKGNKINIADVTSYLTNETKVKISVSPKEIWNLHLQDSSIQENIITNTTSVDETAVSLDMEKNLDTPNFLKIVKAHSRISQGSEGTLSSSDNSHRLNSSCKRDRFSSPINGETTNSNNGVHIVIPLKRKKKQISCIKPQEYDDALDISEQHTHNQKYGDLSISTESSDTSFIKNKAPEHKLKKKKIAVEKKDLFDVISPTSLCQTKQLMKITQSRNGTDSEIAKSGDHPKIFESRSSTDSILNMKPKRLLMKKASKAPEKNVYESLMTTNNNIEPIAEIENKTSCTSSGSASSNAPVAVNVRHKFKHIPLKCGEFDSALENLVIEDSVQHMQPNVNDSCTSGQRSKDISADLNVQKAPAFGKIGPKINKKHRQHNLFESLAGKEESVEQNVGQQQTDIALSKNYAQNTLSDNVSAEMDVLKAPDYPKVVGKINKKHLQHNPFESIVANDDVNVEEQNVDIAMVNNHAQNTYTANTKESMDSSTAQSFAMKVLKKDKRGSITPQTSIFSEIQGHSHNSQSLEGGRQTDGREHNSSINKLVERKFLLSNIRTSDYNCVTLPECGRSSDSRGDSLTISKFRPKITSSKICLATHGTAEECPTTLVAVHNEKQMQPPANPIASQLKSTDNESAKTNCRKRKKSSESDNTLPSSDLTFDADNVPHSTMVLSSSKKKHPPPAVHKIGNNARRSLLNSFGALTEVSMQSGKEVNVEEKNACIRITSNGSEGDNERAIENEGNVLERGELQPNEHHSNTVEKDAKFANKISVPDNLYAMSDHEPFVDNSSTNILKILNSLDKPSSKPSTSNNDVSQVFRHPSHKTKSMVKSSSLNSQEELMNVDSKNEKKQGNYKSVPGKVKNMPENIVCNEMIETHSMGSVTKCSVSLPYKGNISSHSFSKSPDNSYRNAEIKQISLLDTVSQKICNSEVEEIDLRKSDRVSLRAERRKSSSYSFDAVSHRKLSDMDVSTSQKGSNLKSSRKEIGASIENKSDHAEAPNCNEEQCSQKETTELREVIHFNKTPHKENLFSNIKNRSKASIRESNENSSVSNVTNAKIVDSDSSDLCNANNDYLKEGSHSISQIENERGSGTDSQPHLTVDGDANSATGEKYVVSGQMRDLFPHHMSASRLSIASHKGNFPPSIENSCKVANKESNKNLSNAKIRRSDLSGHSNTNDDRRPNDNLKDSLHRKSHTDNGRLCNPDNQQELLVDNEGMEGEGPVIIRQPLKASILTTHRKKTDVKQTQAKPTSHAYFVIGDEKYHKPKLIRPKFWINQRFYNRMLPKFDKKYGLKGSVMCEQFVKSLCDEVTACISNRKTWDKHVDKVQKLLSEYLSMDTYVHFLTFGKNFLPDEFVYKMGLTYEKRCKNK